LKILVAECQGDVADAVRAFTKRGTAELADDLGLPRQSLEQCLRKTEGRRYPHVRAALDAELGLFPGTIGQLLDELPPSQ